MKHEPELIYIGYFTSLVSPVIAPQKIYSNHKKRIL